MNKMMMVREGKMARGEPLEQTVARLEAWLDEAPFGICNTDLKGKITYVNKKFEEASGYSWEDVVGRNGFELGVVSNETLKLLAKRMKEKIMGMPPDTLEIQFRCKDGRWMWAAIKGKLLKEKGVPAGIQIIAQDITERRRAEEVLKQAEENVRVYLENAPDGVYISDLQGTFLYGNKRSEDIVGFKREELVGGSFRKLKLLQKKDVPRAVKLLALNAMGRPTGPDEFELVRKDGSHVWVEINTTPIKQGEEIVVIGFVRDITERRWLDEELKLRAQLLDSATDAILLSDLDGNILYANEAACKSRGYSREEVMRMNHRQLDVPEYAELFDLRMQKLREQGQATFDSAALCKGKSVIPLEVHARIIEPGDRELVLSAARDITERKQAEAEKMELEQKSQLASRLASVGEMASGIAHEINNPLTGIVGYAQLLMMRESIPEDIKRDLKNINDGAQRVAGTIRRMLMFARQHKPERTYVGINDIVTSTLEFRAYELRTSNIEVITQLDPELPFTMADAGQLQQVFLNLVVNAETEMKLAHGKGNLSIKTEKMGSNIRISVQDDGPGIARENMGRLFEPFFSTRETGKGTGLGLSICHGIIAEHNGQIYAESKPGKGATFVVELPVVAGAEQLKPSEFEAEESQELAAARILVVDDEPIVGDFLSQVLTGEGHDVEFVDNASEALEKVKNNRYSLILLDIKMPGMGGIELYGHFRKMAKSLAGRVVFITGDVMGQDTIAFFTKTKAAYVTKPFDVSQLKREINRILQV